MNWELYEKIKDLPGIYDYIIDLEQTNIRLQKELHEAEEKNVQYDKVSFGLRIGSLKLLDLFDISKPEQAQKIAHILSVHINGDGIFADEILGDDLVKFVEEFNPETDYF